MAKKNTKVNKNNLMLMLVALTALFIVFSLMLVWNKQRIPQPNQSPITDIQGIEFSKQGTSDEMGAIEKDLKKTDFTRLDQGVDDIEQNLSQ